MTWVLLVAGLAGAMALAIVLVGGWLNRRKRALVEAGRRMGLTALAPGEQLRVPVVPLLDRPRREYLVVLTGLINGRDGAFLDLFVGSGEQWDLQSTVLLQDPEAEMPRFQLRMPRRWQTYPRTQGHRVHMDSPEGAMHRIELISDDAEWARSMFSPASGRFFERVQLGKWTIEGLGNAVVVYRWGTRVPVRRFEGYVEQAAALAAEVLSLCRSQSRSSN